MCLRWFSRDFFGRFETNLKIVTFWDVILGKWFCQECFKLKNLGHTQNSQYTVTLNQAENDSCQPNLLHAPPFYLPVWVPYMISVAGCQFTFFLRVLFWAAQTWRCERPYFAKGAMRMMVQPRTWSKYLLQLSGQQKNTENERVLSPKTGAISNYFLGTSLVFQGKNPPIWWSLPVRQSHVASNVAVLSLLLCLPGRSGNRKGRVVNRTKSAVYFFSMWFEHLKQKIDTIIIYIYIITEQLYQWFFWGVV